MSFRRSLLAFVPAVLLVSCSTDAPNGPGGPGLASLRLRAEAPPSLSRFGLNLTVEQVKASLVKSLPSEAVETLATKTVPFSANASTLNLSFSLLLPAAVETLSVQLDYQTALGRTLFLASQQVIAIAGQPTSPPSLQPFYLGPGGNVASLSIQPRSGTVTAGGTVSLSAAALDIQAAPIPPDSVYLSWGASAGSVNALGVFTAPVSPGPVTIRVQTPNLVADSVQLTVLAAGVGALSGQVLDGSTGAPLANVTISVFDALDTLVATVQTATDGSYSTPALPPGIYQVTATLNGFVSTTLFNAAVGGGPSNAPPIPLVPTNQALGGIGGVVGSATTGLGIPGATVELRDGVNSTTSTPIATTTTDTGGVYSFIRLPAGTFTVGVVATGFTPGFRTSVIIGGVTSTTDNLSLSPVGGVGLIRAVLTWGATPLDLDLHVTGPDSTGGTRFHVYFAVAGDSVAAPYDVLDIDQTDGFGPETNTLYRQYPGVYRFSVHDYSDALDSTATNDSLAHSNARVDLYLAGVLVQSFFVPNQPGTLWTVFEINGSTITPINAMSFVSNSDAVNLRAGGTTDPTDADVIGRDLRKHPKR